ncbi:MAG: hypothetical protein NT126_04390, partial [Bacteroidetes bacterium]|nr:hypothetical protein [Bacteroidota bacterium]
MKKVLLIFFLTVASVNCVFSQFTDRYWCFGDSAGIDFNNLNNPVSGNSILRSRGTCVSICDSIGNLLFYASTPHVDLWLNPGTYDFGYVVNKNNQIMDGGDSLKAAAWYQEMIIVPDPGNINRFYLFTAGVTSTPIPGFYYSVIDLSYNGGLGRVVQKNIRLQSFPVCDGLAAVKHGNGRDWWVFLRHWDATGATQNDEYYSYLVGQDLIESYDFNRCTGLLSNVNTIQPQRLSQPYSNYWHFAISPNATKLYVSSIYNGPNQDTSYLYQFDLTATNILASRTTLHTFLAPSVAGLLQTGPD